MNRWASWGDTMLSWGTSCTSWGSDRWSDRVSTLTRPLGAAADLRMEKMTVSCSTADDRNTRSRRSKRITRRNEAASVSPWRKFVKYWPFANDRGVMATICPPSRSSADATARNAA